MFLTFVSTALLLMFHRAMFGDALSYIKFNAGSQHLIGWPPLPEIIGKLGDADVNSIHSFVDFYIPLVVGTISVLISAGPPGIFASIYVVYVSFLRHLDLQRYSLPAAVFAYLIGFDSFWSSPNVRKALLILSPIYLVFIVTYAAGQISSNLCSVSFFYDVLKAAEDTIH